MTDLNFSDQGVGRFMEHTNAKGGEIIMPKAPSLKIMDLAEVIAGKK